MFDGMIAALFSIAMGFVTAGICHSGYSLVTKSRLRFEGDGNGGLAAFARGLALVLAGPLIIVRNSWKAGRQGMRPSPWLAAAVFVAAGWSFCLGVAVINIAVIAGA